MNTYDSNKKAIIFFWILIAIAIVYIFITIKNNQPTLMVTYMDSEGIYAVEAGIKKNSKITPPNVEAREGFEFLGWFLDDVLFDFDKPITEDLYLKMKWFKTDTYEIEEISKEQEQAVKEEQQAKKEEGTIKTQTNEEVKEEQQNNPTPRPTPNPTPAVTSTIEFSSSSILCDKGSIAKVTITSTNGIKNYISNDINVATVSDSANQPECVGCKSIDVSCKGVGVSVLTAINNDDIKATTTVIVKENIPITFTSKNITCKKGEVTSVIINGGDTGIKSYTSSNNNITLSENNNTSCTNCKEIKITCNNVGETTIEAIGNDGTKASSKVTIRIDELKVSATSITCKKGDTRKLSITSGTNGVKSYTSSNTNIVELKKSDNQPKCLGCIDLDVICKSAGEANIKVIANDDQEKNTKVTVKETVSEEPLIVSPTSITCTKGENKIITVESGFNNIKSRTSSNPNVASLYLPDGTCSKCLGVSCDSVGETTIKIVSNNNEEKSVKVTVNEAVNIDELKVSPTSITCKKGDVKKLSIISGTNGVKSYTSSNTSVATLKLSDTQPKCLGCVDLDVTCVASGTSNIEVIAKTNGETKTVKVTVEADPTVIEFEPVSITCTKGEVKSITITASPSGVKSYTSSDTNIITLSETSSGECKNCKKLNISCLNQGTANINVEANDGVKANTTVTVNAPAPVVLTPYCTQGELRYNGNSPYCYVACGTEKYGCDVYSACASRQNTCKPGCSFGTDRNGRCEYEETKSNIISYDPSTGIDCVKQPDGKYYTLFTKYGQENCSQNCGSWDTYTKRCLGGTCPEPGTYYPCRVYGFTASGVNNPICYRDYDLPCVTGSENECVSGYVYKENACERTKYCNYTDSSILKYR